MFIVYLLINFFLFLPQNIIFYKLNHFKIFSYNLNQKQYHFKMIFHYFNLIILIIIILKLNLNKFYLYLNPYFKKIFYFHHFKQHLNFTYYLRYQFCNFLNLTNYKLLIAIFFH